MRKSPLAIGLALLGTSVFLTACQPSYRTLEQSDPRTQYVQTSRSPGHGSFANHPSQISQTSHNQSLAGHGSPAGHGSMAGHGSGTGQTTYLQNQHQPQQFVNPHSQSSFAQGCPQFLTNGGNHGQQNSYGGASFAGGNQQCGQPRFVQTGPTYQANIYGTPGVVFTQGGYRVMNGNRF